MKYTRCLVLIALAQGWALWAAPTVEVTTDRADGIYAVGDKAVFTVTVSEDGKPLTAGTLKTALSKDGVGDLGRTDAALTGAPVKVEGSLGEPGVLRLTVSARVGQETLTAWGGAAFSPEKLMPAKPAPADFDEYWAAQKKLLADHPAQPELTRSEKYSTAKADVFELAIEVLNGQKIRGWFCRPKAAGKYPAIFSVPGAGVSAIRPASYLGERYLSVNISVHDQPLDREADFYKELGAGALKAYQYQGHASRDTYYYHRVFLGFVRCFDFLCAQADWDGKHLIVNGSSQGGGSTLVAAGLDPRVTAAAANVPALCDHQGLLVGRIGGWPHLIRPDSSPAAIATMGYYDAAYFAQRIKCPILISCGLIDRTCPATTVFAAYNGIPSADKKLLVYPRMGHESSKPWAEAQSAFIAQHSR